MRQEIIASDSEQAAVKRWCSRIRKAKDHWKDDFERMRENMAFVASFQWAGQTKMRSEAYVANITNRVVQQKTALLYAKNPKAVFERRPRMDFALWDEKLESLQQAIMSLAANPMDMEAAAIVSDYQQGTELRKLVAKVGRTLELVYQNQIDRHKPDYKLQMKQLVRRTVICGVSYTRLDFQRTGQENADNCDGLAQKLGLISTLSSQLQDGEFDKNSAEYDALQRQINAVQNAQPMQERLVFTFPGVTSMVVDTACTCLKGFVGARWLAQETYLSVDELNAFFGTNIDASSEARIFDDGEEIQGEDRAALRDKDCNDKYVRIWQVFNKDDETTFFICDGWPEYLRGPDSVRPRLSQFWLHNALTFNDIETEEGEKPSIFPPSDVDLIWHPQKEYNRSRNELRSHRRANRPKYITGAGWLTEKDKDKLAAAESHAVIELQGVPPGSDVEKMLPPFRHAPLDPALYETESVKQDIMMTTGAQEANIGPLSGGTATEATIAEQSRMSSGSSNVDDVDDLLNAQAEAGGEALIQEMSSETALKIAGRGGAWPEAERELYLDEILLKVAAGSSGKPNKAVNIAAFERVAPILATAGANPNFLVREGIKVYDSQLDPSEAFPLMPMPATASSGSNQPLQDMPSEAPVPLPGA
jgi:hypothetical protein